MFLQFFVNGFITGCGYAMVTMGMALVFGILHIINVAHGVFYTLGAYFFFSVVNKQGIPMIPGIVLVMIIVAAIAVICERLVFKKLRNVDPMMQIIAAFGLSTMLMDLIRAFWSADSLRLSSEWMKQIMHIGSLSLTVQRLVVVAAAILSYVCVALVMRKTKLGLMMRALPQDNMAATLNGMNINKVSAITFALAGAVAAFGAATVGPVYTVQANMGDALGNKAFAAVIAGGIGSVEGAVIASLAMGIIEAFVSGFIATGYENLVTFLILILVLIFKPTGLMGRDEH
jgi:branched-chain amino acid transport system permease protein